VTNDDLFKACFAHATIGFAVADLDGRLLHVNPAYSAITGYSEEELHQTFGYKTLTHPDDLPENIEKLRALMAGDIPAFIIEKRYIKKDRSIVWVRNSVSLMRDHEGRPTHFVLLTEDITEHKLTEATLREVLSRNEAILASVADVHIVLDRGWRVLYANDAAVQAMRRSRSDLLGCTLWELYPDIVATELERQYRRAMNDRVPVAFEFHYSTHDTWWENRFYPTPEGLAVFATDISDRKRAQSARRLAELKYSQIFENAGEGIFQSTPEGHYLTANPALAHIHGFDSPRELIESCKDISREIYVDPARREEFKRLLESQGKVREFEHESFRKDGRKIWISVNARAVRDETGKVLYYEGTVQDISERKRAENALRESEERYRELFENSKDAIYVHDMSGRYTSVNRAAERLSGYTREELIGRHFSDVVTPEYARQVREQLCRRLEESGETTYEVELITKQGQRLPVEVSSRLIVENGLPIGVQGCMRDISERKRAQQASRTYSRQLIEAQEAERRRLSLELHDQLGQILTAVKMNLHALRNNCTSADVVRSIEDNLRVIDEAVDQVRDLSVDLRPLLLDDFGLIVALRWYLDRQAKNSGVNVEFVSLSLSEDDRLPAPLETACFRIVQEGVTNIVRHAHATRISVRLERTGTDLMLVIGDDGTGFDVKAVRSNGSGAATLGLRGMEERAQALAGTLTIDSAPGLGTQICVSFPLANEKARVEQSRSSIDWVRV
jgi:PAS domain S-box-containing protein